MWGWWEAARMICVCLTETLCQYTLLGWVTVLFQGEGAVPSLCRQRGLPPTAKQAWISVATLRWNLNVLRSVPLNTTRSVCLFRGPGEGTASSALSFLWGMRAHCHSVVASLQRTMEPRPPCLLMQAAAAMLSGLTIMRLPCCQGRSWPGESACPRPYTA